MPVSRMLFELMIILSFSGVFRFSLFLVGSPTRVSCNFCFLDCQDLRRFFGFSSLAKAGKPRKACEGQTHLEQMGLFAVLAFFSTGLLFGTATLLLAALAWFISTAKRDIPVRHSLIHRTLASYEGMKNRAFLAEGLDVGGSFYHPKAILPSLIKVPVSSVSPAGQREDVTGQLQVFFPVVWDIPPASRLRQLELPDVFSRDLILSGRFYVQPSGKERLRFRYHCDLYGSLLACQNLEDTRTTMEIFDLSGCQIRHTTLYKHALEIVSTSAALAVGHYHMFFIFTSPSQLQEWLSALLQQGLKLASQTAHELITERLKRGEKPPLGPAITCGWTNRLLARWYLSMKDGDRLRAKIREKLAEKVSVKLFEKGMDSKFQDLRLANVKVGSTAPTLGPIYIHQLPQSSGVFAFDMSFCYEGEFFFSFTTKFMKLQCKASVMLHSLKGRVLLYVEPNSQLYSIAFYEFPEIKWTVKKKVSNSDFALLDLQGIIHDKLKISLSERFVLPNRKFARIPRTNKSYWELPEVAVRATGRLSVIYTEGSEFSTQSLEKSKKKSKDRHGKDARFETDSAGHHLLSPPPPFNGSAPLLASSALPSSSSSSSVSSGGWSSAVLPPSSLERETSPRRSFLGGSASPKVSKRSFLRSSDKTKNDN